MRKRPLITLASIILLATAAILLFMLARPIRPLAVTVTLVGYTNDSTGKRLAAFRISNDSRVVIRRWNRYELELPGQVRPGPLIFQGQSILLAPGQSEAFVISVPANQESWRLVLTCSPYGIRQDFADWASRSGYWKYLPERLNGVPSQFVRSDWIRP